MRVRPLSASGDYTIGVPFLVNSKQAVAQKINTRLKLWEREWFVDLTKGTPYFSQALGERSSRNPDAVIKQRILGTLNVTAITAYSSSFDPTTRKLTIAASVDTPFGVAQITAALQLRTATAPEVS